MRDNSTEAESLVVVVGLEREGDRDSVSVGQNVNLLTAAELCLDG